jgi:hypothetical protein
MGPIALATGRLENSVAKASNPTVKILTERTRDTSPEFTNTPSVDGWNCRDFLKIYSVKIGHDRSIV